MKGWESMSIISTACELFNHVIKTDDEELLKERRDTIVMDDYDSFVSCCKTVINDDTVASVVMTVEKPEGSKRRKGLFVINR